LGGSLKAEGFGDGEYRRRHPQAALEAEYIKRRNSFGKIGSNVNNYFERIAS